MEDIEVSSDSMVIVNQITGEFQAREDRMAKYLGKVKALLSQFRRYTVVRVPRSENLEADALARLASGSDTEGLVHIPIERLEQPSIDRAEEVLFSENTKTWMDPIHRYLTHAELPDDRAEA